MGEPELSTHGPGMSIQPSAIDTLRTGVSQAFNSCTNDGTVSSVVDKPLLLQRYAGATLPHSLVKTSANHALLPRGGA